MNSIYILQGSNEGNSQEFLNLSRIEIERKIGKIVQQSSIYESEPWGFEARQWFLNRVLIVESNSAPLDILNKLLAIELEFGRIRANDGKYHSRTLDLDILFINNEVLNLPELIIPHPQIQNRRFTLLPLVEIAPNFIHPILHKSISELLLLCDDKTVVKLV
jgi:2-amino-4-hydroxy-6-hydroxymethyldihydropteridine diphosphokinase